MTNFGWFHPDPRNGRTYMRCQAMRHFNDAILAHERFNASAWQDLEQNPDPERAIIAFLDFDTCQLLHWPKFGGNEFNADLEGGREPFARHNFSKECAMVVRALQSPALASPDSRLVVMSCKGQGPPRNHCLGGERNVSGMFSKLIVGHMSAYQSDTYPLDFGIPPWPVKAVTLNKSQLDEIETCQKTSRSLLFSFEGRERIPFPEFHKFFKPLHGKGGIHAVFQVDHYGQDTHPMRWADPPRGDCLYSVRFSEILSSGAIPVVYADGWVLPYNRDVVDWTEVAVLIPQGRVNETIEILRAIPDETRCRMRKKGLEVYQRYVADSAGRLRAILEIVDAALTREKRNSSSDPPVEFSSVPES
ncbi:ADP-heptose-lipopolysaccharide heptosyltransferase [Fragilaria crotonensis]|nr:ADP-heptose-lipopolysaccharide heptosyltransferase [Fragilaria crotonensis]